MAIITKYDLVYTYLWRTVQYDNPKIKETPDSAFLNINQGYEMLYYINKVCDILGIRTKEEALEIERLIKEKLPSNIRSHDNILEWIIANK